MDTLQVMKNALAELQGIMPDYDPDGDRNHSGWLTIDELKEAIGEMEGKASADVGDFYG